MRLKFKILPVVLLIFFSFLACSNENKKIKRPFKNNIVIVDEVKINLGALNFAVRVDGWFPENDEKFKRILNIKSAVVAIYAASEEQWLSLQERLNKHQEGTPFHISLTDSFYFVEALKGETFEGEQALQMMKSLNAQMEESAKISGAILEIIEEKPLSQIITITTKRLNEPDSVAVYASFIAGGKVLGIFNVRGSLEGKEKESFLNVYKNWVKQVLKEN